MSLLLFQQMSNLFGTANLWVSVMPVFFTYLFYSSFDGSNPEGRVTDTTVITIIIQKNQLFDLITACDFVPAVHEIQIVMAITSCTCWSRPFRHVRNANRFDSSGVVPLTESQQCRSRSQSCREIGWLHSKTNRSSFSNLRTSFSLDNELMISKN